MIAELKLRQNYLKDEVIQTIYFGGGTPSILSPKEIEELLSNAASIIGFNIEDCKEITLEANPDDLTTANLIAWKLLGVNRLSIGVQSFDDTLLTQLNRTHDAKSAIEGIERAMSVGIIKHSIDLIYGIQNQSHESLILSLKTAINLNPEHISAYALTVETGTALSSFIEKGKEKPIDEIIQAEHFEIVCKVLKEAGYIHYETSNFCKPDHQALHNTGYWKLKPYLGIGPSAHSFNTYTRQWNIANNAAYVKAIAQHIIPAEYEFITEKNRWNEFVMVTIRLQDGISKKQVLDGFNISKWDYLEKQIKKWEPKYYTFDKNTLRLTEEGRFLSDNLVLSIFL